MLKTRFSSKIQRDVKLLEKRGYDMRKFTETVKLLACGRGLPDSYKDHPLKGNLAGLRECHIAPDWLLIYRIDHDELILILTRTGTHADLFKK